METAMFLIQRLGSQILRMAQFSGVPCYLNLQLLQQSKYGFLMLVEIQGK